jgi:hypothetical protein
MYVNIIDSLCNESTKFSSKFKTPLKEFLYVEINNVNNFSVVNKFVLCDPEKHVVSEDFSDNSLVSYKNCDTELISGEKVGTDCPFVPEGRSFNSIGVNITNDLVTITDLNSDLFLSIEGINSGHSSSLWSVDIPQLPTQCI